MRPAPFARQTAPGISAQQRRGIRRTTWRVSLFVLAIYFGYMILTYFQIKR